MAKRLDRPKRSRNKGYFYRSGRGWFSKDGTAFVPLVTEDSHRLREKHIDEQIVRQAHARWLLSNTGDVVNRKATAGQPVVTIHDVCDAYLTHAKL